jgi:hypothetical protein
MAAEMPYKVGDKVRFVPGPEHGLTTTAGGDHIFAWKHMEARGPTRDYPGHRPGDPVDLQTAGMIRRDPDTKRIVTGGGHPIELSHPVYFWPAWIHAVFEDGTVSLSVIDPKSAKTIDLVERLTTENAMIVHRIPNREVQQLPYFENWHPLAGQPNPDAGKPKFPNAPGVPYDPTKKRLHSFHLETD